MGRCVVAWWLQLEHGPAGATVTISPNPRAAAVRAANPGAEMPSSLVRSKRIGSLPVYLLSWFCVIDFQETTMNTWMIAGVQMDCRLADVSANLATILEGLHEAADLGANLIVFPECALTGYCFASKEEAWPHAQTLPGPASQTLAQECRQRGVFVIAGLLERGERGELFNSCLLVGPQGYLASYRKIHLPLLGIDRFTTPGDRPFAVHDLGGLRIGMNICYDGSFPESSRVLTLLGADLVVLPTNWPTGALGTVPLTQARALENHIFQAAVNRIGEERGFRFIGRSRIVDCDGSLLVEASADSPGVIVAEIDPRIARQKRVIKVPGEHEVDRVGDRRPEMYEPLCRPAAAVTSPTGPPRS
jgi:predicted amidohydrolase